MRTRGRVGVAALGYNPVDVVPRLPPPAGLTAEQSAEWIAVVNTMPADHFMRGNQGVLEQYCRHMAVARKLAERIEWYEQAVAKNRDRLDRMSGNEDNYNELAKIVAGQDSTLLQCYRSQKEESQIIQVLLRSMRLTQQSVYRGETVKHPKRSAAGNPWDDNDVA